MKVKKMEGKLLQMFALSFLFFAASTTGTTTIAAPTTATPTNVTATTPTAPTNLTTITPTALTNLTTAIPTNLTTAIPTNLTTTTPNAPTTGSVTTPKPASTSPHLNDYTYKSGNKTCLHVKMTAYFEEQPGGRLYNVTEDARITNGTSCNKLVVSFQNNSFSLTFSTDTSNTSYYLSEVDAHLGKLKVNASNLDVGKVKVNTSYTCAAGFAISMSNQVKLITKNLQFQAYHVTNGKFDTATSCPTDLSPIVPIIVGAVLAGLVVIVIVAYFIGRRRSRSGYEEI